MGDNVTKDRVRRTGKDAKAQGPPARDGRCGQPSLLPSLLKTHTRLLIYPSAGACVTAGVCVCVWGDRDGPAIAFVKSLEPTLRFTMARLPGLTPSSYVHFTPLIAHGGCPVGSCLLTSHVSTLQHMLSRCQALRVPVRSRWSWSRFPGDPRDSLAHVSCSGSGN